MDYRHWKDSEKNPDFGKPDAELEEKLKETDDDIYEYFPEEKRARMKLLNDKNKMDFINGFVKKNKK